MENPCLSLLGHITEYRDPIGAMVCDLHPRCWINRARDPGLSVRVTRDVGFRHTLDVVVD